MDVFKETGNLQIACFVVLFIAMRIALRMYLAPSTVPKKNLFAPDPKYWKKGKEPDENVIKTGYVRDSTLNDVTLMTQCVKN